MGTRINGSLNVKSFVIAEGDDNTGLVARTGGVTSTAGDITATAGNMVITDATKGIIHTNSGTITQDTNHSTTVEVNATSGVIQLAAVALNAAAEADFQVTNSTVKASSVVLLTVQSSAAASATDNASLHAELDDVASGKFNVRLTNPGAGNTDAAAYKIHFLVINNS